MSLRYYRPMRRALALLAILGTACTGEVGSHRRAITGGMPSGESSVVYTIQTGSTVLCAAAVVGPRDLLTVQRCVTPAGSDTPIPPNAINVGIGASVDRPERTVAVEEIFISGGTGPEVLALIRTQSDLGLPALPLPTGAPTVGTDLVIVGYGQTEAAAAGNRHEGDTSITAANGETFDVAGAAFACGEGDDGGPALSLGGELVGVGGLPDSDSCPPTANTYATVFEGLTFIADNLAPPLPDAGMRDAGPDVDAGPDIDAGPGPDAGDGRMIPRDGGCGCLVARPSPTPLALVMLALFALLTARRARSR